MRNADDYEAVSRSIVGPSAGEVKTVVWFFEEEPGNHKWIPFYDVDQATAENAFLNDEKFVELMAENGKTVVVDFESMSQQVIHSESVVGVPHKVCRVADLANSITVLPKPKCDQWLAESNSNISAVGENLSESDSNISGVEESWFKIKP